MNSTKVFQQVLYLNRRGFSSSLYNYTSASNPRAYLTVSRDGKRLGDLVFQLYSNHTPQTAENFLAICSGVNPAKLSYEGTKLENGFPGIALVGGRISDQNVAADGRRLPDENTNIRHYKRGIITMQNDGENDNGSQFMITLDKADMLDGYHVAFGELVEGDDVLKEVEKSLTRQGTFQHEIKIEAAGTR